MKCLLAIVLIGVVCAVQLAEARPEDKYTSKYDNINVDEVLANDRLYQKYFGCLMGTITCASDGKYLRDVIPDALKTKCAKCTEKQKAGAEKVMRYLIEKKPDDWKEIEKKFDPKGDYRKAYQEDAKKRGIKLPS
uniref:Chemosensory protein 1 n=1 Tax=Tropidothorax elegans TaxID=2233830 RepID=A0A2Z5EM91_9HEMI|nr:chemosensory protein 1 [Tropidothorax elegans]